MDDRLVIVVGYDGIELIDLACVTSGFEHANRQGARPPYRVVFTTPAGRPVRSDTGLEVRGHAGLDRVDGRVDTLVVSGGLGHEAASRDPRLVGQVRRVAAVSRRVASVCTGATVLAAAGLLDGRRATTHWHYADALADRFPRVHVDPAPVYVRDGVVSTSGGVTAALDLTLAFVEEDHGAETARRVAMGMVTYLHRPGDQAQVSQFTGVPRPEQLLLRRVVDHVVGHLDDDLGAARLAALVDVSERHLSRLFARHVGRPPARYVRDARLEAASRMLVATSEPLTAVARRCGFASAESLRQAFVARFGLTPSRFRAEHTPRRATGR
ncbi:GlxA family transcriptional regulator [Saccharothrix longispora]|uniref:Transcriptional regulator GlxA family with amidase domain n=1 Tax=Saccharothrix longispora TaxID=33920 RepID=A0ABU1PWX6_9PSEU|nr:helix-turn-helix domain-containing protein [Saccharothrix longispora]MDR6595141.1 transcriptional regulator GlxA family with amidase domain [Saccharothrix longispora]